MEDELGALTVALWESLLAASMADLMANIMVEKLVVVMAGLTALSE